MHKAQRDESATGQAKTSREGAGGGVGCVAAWLNALGTVPTIL